LTIKTSTTSLQPIAVAFAGQGKLVVQTREPAGLSFIDLASGTVTRTLPLSSTTRADTGHDVFHTQAGGLIACASCHPEGRDDGHVWVLDGTRRRTPSLQGTIAGTAPYHWPGDETSLDVLVNDVYTVRMSGQNLTSPVMGALKGWVQAVPQPRAPSWVDPAAAARGEVLFDDATVGCSGCHTGEKFTNNTTVDIGTGGKFQVPPLVGVGWRTPLFHDGCAATLADRFGKCATSQHGNIGALSTDDISDLIAYLETL
jgi:cytochrome c peroxidase